MNSLHKVRHILLTLFAGSTVAFAQTSERFTLEQLQQLSRENYPALKQKENYEAIGKNRVQQTGTNYLPQITITGQGTLQSEVTEFDIPIQGFGGFKPSADQYAAGIEIRENLLDYGAVHTQKEIERANAGAQMSQADADLLKLKERINQLYASICLQKENKNILQLRLEELNAKKEKLRSAVTNGSALQSSFLVLESEYYISQQKLDEVNSLLMAACKSLSVFSGKNIDSASVVTELPAVSLSAQSAVARPEFKMFEQQAQALQLKAKMITKNNLPRLYVFGRGYYGRPGFNFLNDDFRPYGLIGAGINWNLSAYYTSGKEKSNLRLNSGIIDAQRKTFDLNLQSTIIQEQEEINRLEKMIEADKKITEAKTTIRKAASSQLDNGTITPSDYLTELNAESQAQLNMKLHEIQLMMAKINLNTTLGF